jgi:hypothetical protein
MDANAGLQVKLEGAAQVRMLNPSRGGTRAGIK